MCYMYTMEFYSAIRNKEMINCWKIDGPGDHVQCNTPGSERQVLHKISDMESDFFKKNMKVEERGGQWGRRRMRESNRWVKLAKAHGIYARECIETHYFAQFRCGDLNAQGVAKDTRPAQVQAQQGPSTARASEHGAHS